MHKLTRMRYSRDDWRVKARNRADELRQSRKREKRQQQKIVDLTQELERTKLLLEDKKKITFQYQ